MTEVIELVLEQTVVEREFVDVGRQGPPGPQGPAGTDEFDIDLALNYQIAKL
jgi:hypothetical protein